MQRWPIQEGGRLIRDGFESRASRRTPPRPAALGSPDSDEANGAAIRRVFRSLDLTPRRSMNVSVLITAARHRRWRAKVAVVVVVVMAIFLALGVTYRAVPGLPWRRLARGRKAVATSRQR
jgi:hypothetical protein